MRLLDLFCGAGGAAVGYARAFPGVEIVGVDIVPQPRYPFTFVQADAMTFDLAGFDFIHASPPCQAYTAMQSMWNYRGGHPDLLLATRARLEASAAAWVIENVPGAPMPDAIQLCGTSFGLGASAADGWRQLRRHRLFVASFPMMSVPCRHRPGTIGIYGDHVRDRRRRAGDRGRDFPAALGLELARQAMGMPWATFRELSQAIPPAYTQFIGEQFATLAVSS